MSEDLDGLLVGSAAVTDEQGKSALDGTILRIPTARVCEATQRLRAAGFHIAHPGRFAISIAGPVDLYERILGAAPDTGAYRLDPERLKGTAYEPLLPYVAGFEFVPRPTTL